MQTSRHSRETLKHKWTEVRLTIISRQSEAECPEAVFFLFVCFEEL